MVTSDLSDGDNNEELNRIQEAKTLRMNAFKKISAQLRKKALSFDKRSTFIRVIIIVLGALVAVRSVIDQLMIDYQANELVSLFVQVGFLVVGIAISVAAGLQAAFKYEEKAAQLRELANRAYGLTAEYMTKFDKPNTIQNMWELIEEQNIQFRKLLADVSNANVTLESLGISFDSPGLPISRRE